MNRKANVACNFNCLVETEGLFKVIGSRHVHCKSGNILEMVQDTDVAAYHGYEWYMSYWIVAILITLNDFQVSCAVADHILNDVSLQHCEFDWCTASFTPIGATCRLCRPKNPQNLPLQKLNTGICPVGNPAGKKERKTEKERNVTMYGKLGICPDCACRRIEIKFCVSVYLWG